MTLRELINEITSKNSQKGTYLECMSPFLDYELEVWNTDSMYSIRLEVNRIKLDSTTNSIQLEV